MTESPFHAGELEAQAHAGLASRGAGIRGAMPDQHRAFFAQLPWLFAGALDDEGAPLATVLTGRPGFITSPSETRLSIAALPPPEDPAARFLRPGRPIGLLGIEFETRRRNRANGVIASVASGLEVAIDQSFGNCAKYIQQRQFLSASPAPASFEVLAALDDEARGLIAGADTFFVASAAATPGAPGGEVDISHRGGRPGFVRIDGDVLTIPDFAGNNYFNTLGNLLREPRAALLFVDFGSGATLQLQGDTEIVWQGQEIGRLDGAQRLWRLHVRRGWHGRQVLPLRWSEPDYAPTSLQTGIWNDPVH